MIVAVLASLSLAASAARSADAPSSRRADDERLSFQTGASWSPRLQIDSDVAMVYGIDPGLPKRLETWRSHGYRAQVMTGVSWGEYQDYLQGRYDGKTHLDEAQTGKDGNPLLHGFSTDVFYMSPGENYGNYLAAGVRRALDAGTEAIYLEEPEFWVRGGWEENFRREWRAHYGEDWQSPDASVDAQYRASKLKYFLYRRALEQVFDSVRKYGKEHGRDIPCYVPTHSLLNYAHWRIVSPESSLLEVGCDGYIAQVWTGTSRTPNDYQGQHKSRTFETAFLEYGAMQNLVRASGRRVWYLNDPVEDNPNRNWLDYRTNWENTLTASLLQPEVWRYETMPWPERIFTGKYPATAPAPGAERSGIPDSYETEIQAVVTALGDMKQPADSIRWEACGTRGVGVLVSDTMMFQRGDPNPSDPNLGSFYGLAMPLLKRGMPVEPVQIENVTAPSANPRAGRDFLDRYKVLLLTYEGQKPPKPEFHSALADWVKAGGALVVIDGDKDPYNAVREWWNTAPLQLATPRHHLFDALGIARDASGISHVGKGVIQYAAMSPAALTYEKDGAERVANLARQAAEAAGVKWAQATALALRRGPYLIAAGLDETPGASQPLVLKGKFVPLFDPELPVVQDFNIAAGTRALLLDLATLPPGKQGVIAAACGVRDETVTSKAITFRGFGVEGSQAVVRVAMPQAPSSVTIDGKPMPGSSNDFSEGSLRLRFRNAAEGVRVEVER